MFDESNIKPVFSEAEIERRITELAKEIYDYYEEKGEAFWILYPEKGAKVFAEKLRQQFITLEVESKRCQGIISIRASRTKGAAFLNEVTIEELSPQSLAGKNILLVEDIIDQGVTIDAILAQIGGVINSCRICVLIEKVEDTEKPVKPDYVGFEVAEGWVVGMGMDLNEHGRKLPFIGVIESGSC